MLSDRTCRPILASEGRLPADTAVGFLTELGPAWRLAGDRLRCVYTVKDFAAAVAVTAMIGQIADEQDHHPDLTVSYGKVAVELWTHTVDGLSESDFIVAAKIDRAVMAAGLETSGKA